MTEKDGGLAPAPDAPSTAAEARACAVIGCRQPHRSLGYCAAHYQKRRLMVSTGRLHAAWVEDAAPHTLPDVFFARKRRSSADAPSPKPPVSPTPRMWVRKKGQVPHDAGALAPATTPVLAADEQQPPVRVEAAAPVSANDKAAASAAAQRWASDFLAQKRRPTSLAKGSHPW
ncbi:cell wall protein [Corallococcus sp. H22C18031201]|nr:cell wall protein [Corallococcus sp. H22C18031201]